MKEACGGHRGAFPPPPPSGALGLVRASSAGELGPPSSLRLLPARAAGSQSPGPVRPVLVTARAGPQCSEVAVRCSRDLSFKEGGLCVFILKGAGAVRPSPY